MWGVWGRADEAECGGPRVRAVEERYQGAEGEKRACVVARAEVPRVQREAGNRGVRALRLRGGWAGSGGLRVEGEFGGSRGCGGWMGRHGVLGYGRGGSLAGGCGCSGVMEGRLWAASSHLRDPLGC